jgi:hypothetical protein
VSAENVGKHVTWKPHVHMGEKHLRTGEIVAFVPAWSSLLALADAGRKVNGGSRRVDADDRSRYPRYVIRVDRANARGQTIAPAWFAPLAAVIDRVIAEAEK